MSFPAYTSEGNSDLRAAVRPSASMSVPVSPLLFEDPKGPPTSAGLGTLTEDSSLHSARTLLEQFLIEGRQGLSALEYSDEDGVSMEDLIEGRGRGLKGHQDPSRLLTEVSRTQEDLLHRARPGEIEKVMIVNRYTIPSST